MGCDNSAPLVHEASAVKGPKSKSQSNKKPSQLHQNPENSDNKESKAK